MRWIVGMLVLLAGCAAADSAEKRGAPRTVQLDSLTVTDSVGLAVGDSKRIRIAYWAEDSMVYCAMATLAAVAGVDSPIISEERSCRNVALLVVDSVRFPNGMVTTPDALRQQTALRIEPRR